MSDESRGPGPTQEQIDAWIASAEREMSNPDHCADCRVKTGLLLLYRAERAAREKAETRLKLLDSERGRCSTCTGHVDPWVRESAFIAMKARAESAEKERDEARAKLADAIKVVEAVASIGRYPGGPTDSALAAFNVKWGGK